MDSKKPAQTPAESVKEQQKARLAAALRKNLQRRKAAVSVQEEEE